MQGQKCSLQTAKLEPCLCQSPNSTPPHPPQILRVSHAIHQLSLPNVSKVLWSSAVRCHCFSAGQIARNTTHGIINKTHSDNSEDCKHRTVCPWWQMKETLSSRSAMIPRQLQKEDWVNKQVPHTSANYKARFPFHLCEAVHVHNPSL